jgi:hypothetical protein
MEWDKGSCGPAPDTRGLKTDHGARLATRRRHIVRARPAKGARKPPKPNPLNETTGGTAAAATVPSVTSGRNL